MRRLFRPFAAASAVLIIGTGLAACSKSNTPAATTTAPPTSSAPINVTPTSFTNDFSAMKQLTGLAAQGKGLIEAARRAGVQVKRIKTLAFMLVSFTAAIAGIVYASRLRSVSTSVDGGTLVLYSVAAIVIGGTSLFGGRGKALHAVLGGLVIAAIANGMGLMGYTTAPQEIVTGLVLIAAVTIDALAHRGRVAGT